jgi:membrane protein YqaA with SNARE-associated domain
MAVRLPDCEAEMIDDIIRSHVMQVEAALVAIAIVLVAAVLGAVVAHKIGMWLRRPSRVEKPLRRRPF